ncbi:MAG: PKD domain-containing protein [Candidatus Pseudobacter hemicellulosilyticus]|uniref:PKD domain-containing protein n=1 Tax=Candidatus Pseudobacter hemicellulosilyticus TaxID=3121375 RepID=A0AAJ6BJ74_9BACT|nr:MAG: PKD domain-containing protein [Pseudobacter sp.]
MSKKNCYCLLIGLCLALGTYAQAPVAAFSANRVSGCSPISVSFRDESSGSPKFWSWDFGNGQFSNQQNPTVAYSQPGTYSVSLVVQNGDGTHGITKTGLITVNPSPSAGFRADRTVACLPADIRFTDNSSSQVGNLVSWEWDFGDGTTSTQQSPSKTYTTEGFYTVSLRVTSSTGCQAARTQGRYIRVLGSIKPEFDVSLPATCQAPFAVNFSNLTSGPGRLTYEWNLGNSSSSTDATPTTSYPASGNYTITLKATSEYGCVNTIQRPITVNGTATNFSGPDTICLDGTASFQNASGQTPVSSIWRFGNGSESDQLNGASAPYTVAGNYTVKLINTYAHCTDSVTKPLYVAPPPPVPFGATNNRSCKPPLTVNFQDRSNGSTSWLWDFGDGNTSTQQHPGHEYIAEGYYPVSLTITNKRGCTNTITQNSLVRIVEPVVRISNAPGGGCLGPSGYTYTAVPSVTALDGVARYEWDFGNGVTRTGQHPGPVTYSAVGEYTLTLKVTTTGGCEETLTLPRGIRVGLPPTVNYSMTNAAGAGITEACVGESVHFHDMSTGRTTNGWEWDFGDGETATEKNPQHRFAKPGTYTVTFIGFNNRCGGTPMTKTILVKPPMAAFSYAVTCDNQRRVTFTNESDADPAYGPYTYSWEFSDGTTQPGSTTPLVKTFGALGSYSAKLTASNGTCTHSSAQNIELVGEEARFTVDKPVVCRDIPSSLTANPANPANIIEYLWTIGTEAPAPGAQTITPSFTQPGVYPVTLRITDINNCRNDVTIADAITVTGPTAEFGTTALTGCANTPVLFTDRTSSVTPISKWTFDFGDGKPASTFTSAPLQYAYTDTGKFQVTMTVEDQQGCQHSYTQPDLLHITRPLAGFRSDYTSICPRTNIQFTDTSKGIGLSYSWDFGNGSTSTEQHPRYAYPVDDGKFSVSLLVRDANGCTNTASFTDYITVVKPKPAFDIADTTTICPPLETKFTFRGQDYESFYWEFGDGESSTLTDPFHFYNNYNINGAPYQAKLVLIGYGGCEESLTSPVSIYNPNTFTQISYSPTTACDSLTVHFNLLTPPSTTYSFQFADGGVNNNQETSFSHFYANPNYYNPRVILTDQQQCVVTVGGPTTVRIHGAPILFGMDQKKFCDEGTVYFTDYTQQRQDPIRTRTWELEPGVFSSEKNPVHHFTTPGTYYVRLRMETDNNCRSEKTDTVRVYRTPDLSITGDDIACINETFPLQGTLAVPDTAITWKWDLAGGGSAGNTDRVSASYGSTGQYTVQLEATNLLGCKDNTSKQITVAPQPVINILNNPTIALGSSINLPVTYGPDIVRYTWTPVTDLNCTDCATPLASPRKTITYQVAVEDQNGCTNSSEVTVSVVCNEENYFVPNSFSPNGDGRNDVFYPRGKSISRISSMRIFTRWGEMVYEKRNFNSNDATAGWDGTFKGKPANADVYIYIVEFICNNSAIIPVKGDLMLMR